MIGAGWPRSVAGLALALPGGLALERTTRAGRTEQKSVMEGTVRGLYFGRIELHQKPRSKPREDPMP